jgi:NAD(P)H dehydrogenase (quinone)
MPSLSSRRPRHAVILCHPDPASFNAAVAERYIKTVEGLGHEAVLRDLYRLHFDPVLRMEEQPMAPDFMLSGDVAEEISTLAGIDVLVLVYPIWFGLPPAMLKGYVDRVLGAGVSPDRVHERGTHPFLTGKFMLSFSSSGLSKQWLEEQGAWLSLCTVFDHYIEKGFSLEPTEHVHFSSIAPGIKPRVVEEHLFEVEEAARKMCARLLSKGWAGKA